MQTFCKFFIAYFSFLSFLAQSVCSLTNHVPISPCSSMIHPTYQSMVVITASVSELLTSNLTYTFLRTSNVTGTPRTISISSTSTITNSTSMTIYSNNSVEPTTASKISLLRTDVVTESLGTVLVSHTDTIITSTSISYFSNTGIQPTATVTYVSTAGVLSTVGGIRVSVNCGLPETKRTTPLMAGTPSVTSSSISTSDKTNISVAPSQSLTESVASSIIKGTTFNLTDEIVLVCLGSFKTLMSVPTDSNI